MFIGASFCFVFLLWGCLIQGDRIEFRDSITDLHENWKLAKSLDGDKAIFMKPVHETLESETAETFIGQRKWSNVLVEDKYEDEVILHSDLLKTFGEGYQRSKRIKKNLETDFQNDFFKAHNEFRAKHGVPPLKLNDTLSNLSQRHAESLHRTNKYERPDAGVYGENIYQHTFSDSNYKIDGEEVVGSWYKEISLYTFGQEPEDDTKVGRFTQLIWKETRELGMGLVQGDDRICVVAYYYPAGNHKSEYVKNVPPPIEVADNDTRNSKNSNFSG